MAETEEKVQPQDEDVVRIENLSYNDAKPPSCCFCMDVRVGTIMIGFFYMIIHSAWLIAITAKAMRHRYLQESKVPQYWSDFDEMQSRHKIDQNLVGMVLASLCFVLVILLIYGAALRRSSYILPFFCLQIFGMSVTIMMAVSMTSYASQVKFYLENTTEESHHEYSTHMSMAHFRCILITFWLIVLTIKYYMISVVWDCYKHCKGHEQRRARMEINTPSFVFPANMDMAKLLPSYEDAVKPPPAYTN